MYKHLPSHVTTFYLPCYKSTRLLFRKPNHPETELNMFSLNGRVCLLAFILSNISEVLSITSGNNVTAEETPWHVQLVATRSQSSYICGGTLVTPDKVLTAAFCKSEDPGYSYTINVGGVMTDGADRVASIQVARIDLHPKFEVGTFDYAVAMATLAEVVTFSNFVHLIAWNDLPEVPAEHTSLQLAGNGREADGQSSLQRKRAYGKVLSQRDCDELVNFNFDMLEGSAVCVRFHDEGVPAGGDYGGGIVMDGKQLVGVFSARLDQQDGNGVIGVHIKTSFVAEWISSYTASLKPEIQHRRLTFNIILSLLCIEIEWQMD